MLLSLSRLFFRVSSYVLQVSAVYLFGSAFSTSGSVYPYQGIPIDFMTANLLVAAEARLFGINGDNNKAGVFAKKLMADFLPIGIIASI